MLNLESDPTSGLDVDRLLPLTTALAVLPRRPSPPTLWRWRVRGVNGVRLECVRCGGQWLTTARAVAAFMAAQTLNSQPHPAAPETSTRSAELERRLQDAGLLESRKPSRQGRD